MSEKKYKCEFCDDGEIVVEGLACGECGQPGKDPMPPLPEKAKPGSMHPVVGRTVEELETDCRIWEQNARGVLAKLKDEQGKNRNLMKLIWAIVLKHGGETRLSDIERGVLRDDWELLEYTDMETLELVIKARSAPNDKSSHTAGRKE